MDDPKMLARAIAFAADAHAGQRDKTGQPYIQHPLRVMLRMGDDASRAAAVLHDVLEDAAATLADLEALDLPDGVGEAVVRLTHRSGQSYDDYVRGLRGTGMAEAVKRADLADNLDPERLALLGDRGAAKAEQYHRALRILDGDDA
jgi:(p)ppGpp synthase/HD superfamily hydrolase